MPYGFIEPVVKSCHLIICSEDSSPVTKTGNRCHHGIIIPKPFMWVISCWLSRVSMNECSSRELRRFYMGLKLVYETLSIFAKGPTTFQNHWRAFDSILGSVLHNTDTFRGVDCRARPWTSISLVFFYPIEGRLTRFHFWIRMKVNSFHQKPVNVTACSNCCRPEFCRLHLACFFGHSYNVTAIDGCD